MRTVKGNHRDKNNIKPVAACYIYTTHTSRLAYGIQSDSLSYATLNSDSPLRLSDKHTFRHYYNHSN